MTCQVLFGLSCVIRCVTALTVPSVRQITDLYQFACFYSNSLFKRTCMGSGSRRADFCVLVLKKEKYLGRNIFLLTLSKKKKHNIR